MKKITIFLLFVTAGASSYGVLDNVTGDIPEAWAHYSEGTVSYIVKFAPPQEKAFYRKLFCKEGGAVNKWVMVLIAQEKSRDVYQLGTIVALANKESEREYLGGIEEK